MFSQKHRLTTRDAALFWKRRDVIRRTTPFFAVYGALNGLTYNRYTVVVGIKVDRRAVGRNTIKRRLRAMLATMTRKDKGKDIALVVLPKIRAAKREEIEVALGATLKILF